MAMTWLCKSHQRKHHQQKYNISRSPNTLLVDHTWWYTAASPPRHHHFTTTTNRTRTARPARRRRTNQASRSSTTWNCNSIYGRISSTAILWELLLVSFGALHVTALSLLTPICPPECICLSQTQVR